MHPVSCLMSRVSCILYLVSCIMYHVSSCIIMYHQSCIIYNLSSLICHRSSIMITILRHFMVVHHHGSQCQCQHQIYQHRLKEVQICIYKDAFVRCLFQTIKCLFQSTKIIWIVFVFKSNRLTHVSLFLQFSI